MSDTQPISSLTDLDIDDKTLGDVFPVAKYNTAMRTFEDKENQIINALSDRESNWAGPAAPTDNTIQGKLWMDTSTDRLKLDPDGSGADQPLARVLTVDLTAVSQTGDTAGDLITYTIPANILKSNGKILRITAWGTKTNASADGSILFRMGGTTLATFVIAQGADGWWLGATYIRTGLNAQYWCAECWGMDTSGMHGAAPGATSHLGVEFGTDAETDTSAIIFALRNDGTGNSNDTITQEGLLVELIN